MKMKFILSVFVSMCLAAAAFAQTTKSNFAGEWELDVAKSTLPEMMQVEAMTLKVAQTDKELSVQTVSKRSRTKVGADLRSRTEPTMTYTLDGKEMVNESTNGVMVNKETRRAELTTGGRLNLTVMRNISGAGNVTMKTNEIWELTDAGKALKVTRYMETPRGAMNAEMFFTRKTSAGITVEGDRDIPGGETSQAPVENGATTRRRPLTGSILNGKAKSLVKPAYPPAARAVKASGAVNVQVTVDEQGNVVSASAVSGHPLLRQAAEEAARASTFEPTMLEGQAVSITGIIVYNFVP